MRCAGGSVQLSCGSESLWRRLCAEFELDADAPGLATNGERVGNRERVIGLLEEAFAGLLAQSWSRHGIREGESRITITAATFGLLALPADIVQTFAAPALMVEGAEVVAEPEQGGHGFQDACRHRAGATGG